MSEEMEMPSSDESNATQVPAPNPENSLEDEAGQEKPDNVALNSDINQNESIEVATHAPNKSPDEAVESDSQMEPQESENNKHLSSVPEDLQKESSINTIDQDLGTLNASPKSTPNNASSANKSKARRKSSGVPEHRTKKINKKPSKAKMTHIDAKPGDYFYVRLKGYPLWPAIVCDEEMLPKSLLKTRPVTAARADGSYREDFMDGAPKAKDRSFPVMYLHTNEFGWIPNYDLLEIDFDEIKNVTGSMRKDLALARQLAAERHDLDYFKEILKSFMEATENERLENEREEEEKVLPKEKKDSSEKKTPRKPKKSKPTVSKDEDSTMLDLNVKTDSEDQESNYLAVCVKRPAEELLEGPPKKRTTIKLTTKAKPEVIVTPKDSKASDSKKTKSEKSEKVARVKKIKVSLGPTTVAIEPELTTEEKRVKREKEILFLRHKLQKGLLAKDQEVKIEDMKLMSEFIEKLEAYNDLEATIIRQTKINKVLKAILKIPIIPLENEYKFKSRSQNLLDQWNKLQTVDSGNPALLHMNGITSEVKSKPEEGDALKSKPKEEAKTEKVVDKDTEISANETTKAIDNVTDSIADDSKKV
ncbi:putative pwwp domain-containing protein [Erysiphe neolycopersici]|uniref:Putative pwwp domain-containing protein n=1 Tax=Erysiphe neolycopersici TaxID=212602 RepID=A0A420HNR6_9PEZI|nr:putative pwwp domain-containing protein [Erysiphe neolycopersici]